MYSYCLMARRAAISPVSITTQGGHRFQCAPARARAAFFSAHCAHRICPLHKPVTPTAARA
jgi:hypothetical protein